MNINQIFELNKRKMEEAEEFKRGGKENLKGKAAEFKSMFSPFLR